MLFERRRDVFEQPPRITYKNLPTSNIQRAVEEMTFLTPEQLSAERKAKARERAEYARAVRAGERVADEEAAESLGFASVKEMKKAMERGKKK